MYSRSKPIDNLTLYLEYQMSQLIFIFIILRLTMQDSMV